MHKLVITPRQIFNLPLPVFEEGSLACLSFFDPEMSYTWPGTGASLGSNDAFAQKTLKGKVYGIFSNNQLVLHA